MKIGILGSGDVGQALGKGFADHGHEVRMGSRDPGQEKVRKWLERTGGNASAGNFADAAAFGDLIVFAVLGAAAEQVVELAGPEHVAGKVVIDTTNPLDFSQGMPPSLFVGHTDSLGERVQRMLPDAKVVKAFNHVPNSHMIDPDFPCGPPDMFICGNDAGAKETVTGILEDFGWPVIDLGGIEYARYLEPLTMLWVLYLMQSGKVDHVFKLLRK